MANFWEAIIESCVINNYFSCLLYLVRNIFIQKLRIKATVNATRSQNRDKEINETKALSVTMLRLLTLIETSWHVCQLISFRRVKQPYSYLVVVVISGMAYLQKSYSNSEILWPHCVCLVAAVL